LKNGEKERDVLRAVEMGVSLGEEGWGDRRESIEIERS
jgi:hypothetical protein